MICVIYQNGSWEVEFIHCVFLYPRFFYVFILSDQIPPNPRIGTSNQKTTKCTRLSLNNRLALTHSILGKNFSRRHFEMFFLFSQETRVWYFTQIFSKGDKETICIKYQTLFFLGRKTKEKISICCLLSFCQKAVKIKFVLKLCLNKNIFRRIEFRHLKLLYFSLSLSYMKKCMHILFLYCHLDWCDISH